MAGLDETQLVTFLEAVYALELDDETWIRQALTALSAVCGAEHHYLGFFYDASDVENFKLWNTCITSAPPELASAFAIFQTLTGPDFVRATFRSLLVGSARRSASPFMEPVLAERERAGWGDIFNVNGLDPSGIGCNLTFGVREREYRPSAKELLLLRRIATHLGTAFRCRRRLGVSRVDAPLDRKPDSAVAGAEAVLDDRGQFVHATGIATGKEAQAKIRASVAAIEGLRTKQGREAGHDALNAWQPLTRARWTLVDSFEENGRRYVVARENQAQAQGFTGLTDRERQVVLHAALGFSNKQIAYTLGISDTTVRVLMARAANRMGVRTRRDLLAHPALQEIRPPASAEPD